jgi:RNA polymerase sigma-70 factor, ECF subfamily
LSLGVRHQADEPSAESLLTRFQAGEKDLFGCIVRRFERELFTYLLQYLGERTAAEDVFQNTFLQVYTKIQKYEKGRPARPWLYRIATNLAIDYLRSQKRFKATSLDVVHDANEGMSLKDLLVTDTVPVADALSAVETEAKVRQAVDALPEPFRSVLILAFYHDMKYTDIAEVMDVPVGTVKSRLHNALKKLHEIWVGQTSEQEIKTA